MSRYDQTRWIFRRALQRGPRGTGSSVAFLERRTAVQPVPDLGFLAPIAWAIVGSIALRAYMPERATQDVAIMIHAQDEASVQAASVRAGYTIAGPPSIEGVSAEDASGNTIDVLTSSASWLDEALASPGRDAAGYPVMPRPYLMLLKLEAGRPQDWVVAQHLLRNTPPDERNATRALIARYIPALVEDYDSLITLADWEYGTRSRRGRLCRGQWQQREHINHSPTERCRDADLDL